MKRMFTLNSKSRSRWMLLLLFLLAGVTDTLAQNVTIKATNGSMIASMAKEGVEDQGYKSGGFATWQHEQLSMVLTSSDYTSKTPEGQLDNPANNLYTDGEYMQVCKGWGQGYLSLSLPKGYRFTGYTIKFKKPGELTKGSDKNTVVFNGSNNPSTFGETSSDFGTYITSATVQRGGASATISRTEQKEGDMSNVLYFRLGPESNSFEIITLESAEFFFTAEENYSPVVPAGAISSPVSAVNIPFNTSKVDYGKIDQTTYFGNSRITYTSANVTDLKANFVLYEEGSIKDGTGIDGISGKVVDFKDGTISSAGGYFKLGKADAEQVYYLETPTYVELSDNEKTKSPVGYRIVGAEIVYKTLGAETDYYITYTSGGKTYYLGTNGQFSTNKTKWETDDNGRIHSGNTYLGYTSDITWGGRTFTFKTFNGAPSNPLYVNSNNQIYGSFSGIMSTYTVYLYHNGTSADVSTDTSNLATWTSETETQADNNFTLYVYDKEGKNPQEITVSGNGTYDFGKLNNDAIKFGVKGIGLVRATLTVQALDPYLDHMTVVCQNNSNDGDMQGVIRTTQDFTASDFSVSGGEFYFHLPSEMNGKGVKITFEDLKSKYFDETYTGGNSKNNSRINFVRSEHYDEFGTSNNSVYSKPSEAANAQKERLKVGIVGTQPFKFNNADEVGTSGGTLTEYPFSIEKYADEPNGGSFDDMLFTVSATDQHLTRYVFTADETRYNIAPTTATQHRAYAFYTMIVHVQSKNYDPKVKFTKVYDETLYRDEEDNVKTDAFYGVEITAPVEEGSTEQGYASTNKVWAAINKILTETHKDDFDNSIPNGVTAKQILYIDFSKLKGVYQITTQEHGSMDDYSKTNAANCMIFLPKGSSAPNNNVAYQMESGRFQAANNIVLTDMQPFYSPYDIQVSGANTVSYDRKITVQKNGQVTSATLILPFNLRVDANGNHINEGEAEAAFSLHQMQASDCITDREEGAAPFVYFPLYKSPETVASEDGSYTVAANTPYLVKVLKDYSGQDAISFAIVQKGAELKATPTEMQEDYTFTGETASGTAVHENGKRASYTFTAHGSYAGKQLEKASNSFYFAKNMFICSSEYSNAGKIKIAPFRTYYSTQTQSGNNAKLMGFNVLFEEGEGNETTGINSLMGDVDLKVTPGNGAITFTSTVDQMVRVNSVSGVLVENAKLQAGETRTISVPAGMYVINGVKIIVK